MRTFQGCVCEGCSESLCWWVCAVVFPLLSSLTAGRRRVWGTGRAADTWLWEQTQERFTHTHTSPFPPKWTPFTCEQSTASMDDLSEFFLRHWGLNGNQDARCAIRSHVCHWLWALMLLGAVYHCSMCFTAPDASSTQSSLWFRAKSLSVHCLWSKIFTRETLELLLPVPQNKVLILDLIKGIFFFPLSDSKLEGLVR